MADEVPHAWHTSETDDLFDAILSLRTRDEAHRFFRDLCTMSELEAMTHRWRVSHAQDLLLVQAIYGALYPQNPHFTLQDILDLLRREPRLVGDTFPQADCRDELGHQFLVFTYHNRPSFSFFLA